MHITGRNPSRKKKITRQNPEIIKACNQSGKTHASITENQQGKRRQKYLKSPGGELDSDSRFGLQAELVSSEPGEDVGFANT